MAGIKYLDYYIPQNKTTVSDLLTNSSKSNKEQDECEKYYNSCSVERISRWKDEPILEVVCGMIERLIHESGINAKDVKYLFMANPRFAIQNLVNVPYYIKEKFDFENMSIIFLNQICASSIMAFGMASQLIGLKQECAMVLSLNAMNDHERIRNFTVAGDGAGVALIGNDNCIFSFENFLTKSFGKNSLNRYDFDKAPMTGLQIAKVAVSFIRQIFHEAEVDIADINQIIAQNTNRMQLEIFEKLLKVPENFIFKENISKCGHIGDVDTIRNLKDFEKSERGRYLLYASGLYETEDIFFAELLLKK